MPKVSVIIPTYNRAAMVRKAVESVLQQTQDDYEVIVADDGSTDNTRETIEGLSDKIRYLRLEHRGRSHARNRALAVATGDYIAFLDSDDLFLSYTLETQMELLEKNPDYGMVYGPAICCSEEAEGLSTYETDGSGWLYRRIAFLFPLTIVLCSVMVRRSVMEKVGGFDEHMDRFEDTDMWRRISRHCQILAADKPLCKIFAHEGNRMQQPARELRCIKYYTRKVFREDRDVDRAFKRRGSAALFDHYCRTIWEGNPDSWAATRFALWAIFYRPSQWQYYRYLFPQKFWQSRLFHCSCSFSAWLRLGVRILILFFTNPFEFLNRTRKMLDKVMQKLSGTNKARKGSG